MHIHCDLLYVSACLKKPVLCYLFTADGQAGGGGGGRISVHYRHKQFKGHYQAYGGKSESAPGGPGTVTEVKTGITGRATYLFVDAGYLYRINVSSSGVNCMYKGDS